MRITITGASGFVGANLCRYFAARGHEVTALVGTPRGDWRLPADDATLRKERLDLADEAAVRDWIARHAPEAWLHCAAYGAYPSQSDAARIYRINFDSVRWIVEDLRKVAGFKAFVQMGSQSEYGLNCSAPSEDSATLPDSDYAVSKVAATALTQFYGKKRGFPGWVFRLYSVYGPYEETSRLIPRLLLKAAEGHLPDLVSPQVSRDFIHVDDVCRAAEAVLSRASALPRGEVFNIGTGECTTLEKLVELVRGLFGITENPRWGSMPNRTWDHADWFADPTKAKRDLQWSSAVPLRDGISRTMAWIKSNPDVVRQGIEQSVLR